VTDDELLDMAGSDPALAKVVRASLERLRDGSGDKRMQELARDVLDERIELRSVASTSTYADVFTDQFRRLQLWREQIGEQEYERHATEARLKAERWHEQQPDRRDAR
jgi:hypothetical protein